MHEHNVHDQCEILPKGHYNGEVVKVTSQRESKLLSIKYCCKRSTHKLWYCPQRYVYIYRERERLTSSKTKFGPWDNRRQD